MDEMETGNEEPQDGEQGSPANYEPPDESGDYAEPEEARQPDAEIETTEEEPVPEPEYHAAAPNPPLAGFTAAEQARLDELAITSPTQAIQEIALRLIQQNTAVSSISGYHLAQARRQSPAFFAIHESAMIEGINSLPVAQRASEDAVTYATLYAIGKEATATKDLKGAIVRAAKLIEQGANGRAEPGALSRSPLAASQRVPSPGVSTAAARGGERSPARAPRGVDILMRTTGMSRAEAEQVARAMD